jgi:Na+:H+ antiporter, NhaA family
MPIRKYLLNPVKVLAEQGKLSGILLICATIISLLLSNSERGQAYLNLWETEVGFDFLHKSMLHWVNDGFMVIFFLLVGLEIKREMVNGELSSFKQSILPVLAAVGGVVVPSLIYVAFNIGSPETLHGWAIPSATDIAFSLGILSLLGNRIPLSWKVFLMALAIIDDLVAILIIAIFYSTSLNFFMLGAGGVVFIIMLLMNRFRVTNLGAYLIPGLLLWYFIMKSGIHPTIAGVLAAFAIPLVSGIELEHRLTRPVNYAILPLFALANTAIPLSFSSMEGFVTPLSLGIILGLFIGKPLGIVLSCYLMKISGIAKWPSGANWKQLTGVGFTAGIGFTMSIFIASLSFTDYHLTNQAKLAIIAGSLIAAIAGLIILYMNPGETAEEA